jgi:hypothetical protein
MPANSTFTELVTTTLRNHPDMMSDNVSLHNGLYSYLKSKGKIKKVSGGYEIVRPIDHAENSTYQRFSGYDTLSIAASDVLSAAKYDWVQAAVHVVASGLEIRINSGSEQIRDLVKDRLKNAMRTAANNMSLDMYSSGALPNQMGGLGALVTADGTGTVGGIIAGTYTMWKNQFYECPSTPSATNIRQYMNRLFLQCTRGADQPDLIILTNDLYTLYWDALAANQRYTNDKAETVNAGYPALKFIGSDVIHDVNSTFTATSKLGYFLNTNFIELVVHQDANWTATPEKMSTNQDAVIHPILWQGQLCLSNRALQGRLQDAT